VVEQRGLAAKGDVPEQHQARVFAVDLARVDAGLGEQRGLVVAARAPAWPRLPC